MNKRGISAVVATVLIVLIVVAGAAFVWMGVAPVVDEIEEVDEEAMEMASSVGRAVRNLFKNLPLEAMNQINADTIGEQLNELGYGIYELFLFCFYIINVYYLY